LQYIVSVESWPMVGSAERLGRAMNNVLDNAAKFAPSGSAVTIDLHAGTLTVGDQGPGVPDDDLPHIFDRFFRANDGWARQGSGLGLAIVKQVVESHGGSVSARTVNGGGLELSLLFPRDGA
jgi:signal transduction histidine kinase